MQNSITNIIKQILTTDIRTHNEQYGEIHNGKYAKIRNVINILQKKKKKKRNFLGTTDINMKRFLYN